MDYSNMSVGAMQFDVVIVGGGPSGLCFAASLRNQPLRIALVDQLRADTLRDPPYDGREIALTQRSVRLLRHLGLWARFPAQAVSPIRAARILNGSSPRALNVRAGAMHGELGFLVSNHLIRRAAYENVVDHPGLTLLPDSQVQSVSTDAAGARVVLSDGRVLEARLVVAADSRFSATRRAVGIAARSHDFGKSMLVCRMHHEEMHEHVALEWFAHEQTLAALPMNGNQSSIVVTLGPRDIERLRAMSPQAFAREMETRFCGRLGAMSLDGERFAYPLVAVYPLRFVASRCAMIGDAAVGMHPVTAHGFNFGLSGQSVLAGLLAAACARDADVGADGVLREYESIHRRATRPLYLATNAIVGLYTTESPRARFLRRALLHAARRTPPIASLLSSFLTAEGAVAHV
jgi:ubiquinone biosynthesis UbiH/UbiF/VisC/COQ6 family hydroxylase